MKKWIGKWRRPTIRTACDWNREGVQCIQVAEWYRIVQFVKDKQPFVEFYCHPHKERTESEKSA